MKSKVEARALLLPARCRAFLTHGMSWAFVTLVLSLSLCLSGCYCSRLHLLDNYTANITVPADNTCLQDSVLQAAYKYYEIDVQSCYADNASYLSVEAWITSSNVTILDWALLINNQGLMPYYDQNDLPNSGTIAQHIDAVHQHKYALVNLTLGPSLGASPGIFASVYSSSGSMEFVIKSWCSATNGCTLSCSDPDSGPCVSVETCRCLRDTADATCDIDEEYLPGMEDVLERGNHSIKHNQVSLGHGEWKYFQFEVEDANSRILVEMARAYGDVALFLKPEGAGSFPSEIDFYKYADVKSFQNRLSHHHLYTIGSGKYYVGVYNSDVCVREDTYFNLSISFVSAGDDSMTLCPTNCSYPNGNCLKDNYCQCAPGFGGSYCEGSFWPVKPQKTFSGQLQPGEWAYFSILPNDVAPSNNFSVKFLHDGGHPILLAKEGGYPTLTDYYLKFTDSSLQATASNVYQVDRDSLSDGNLILAVFNVDYRVQGELQFEIVILGALKGLKVWLILLVAICCSLLVLGVIVSFRYFMYHGGDRTGDLPLDFEATQSSEVVLERLGLDRGVVNTFQLLSYKERMFSKEESRCPICLADYNVPELLRRIPVCRHIFHVNCIDEWFQSHSSCPLCRISLQGTPFIFGNREPVVQLAQPGASSAIGSSRISSTESSILRTSMSASSPTSDSPNKISPSPLTVKDYEPLLLIKTSISQRRDSESDSSSEIGTGVASSSQPV